MIVDGRVYDVSEFAGFCFVSFCFLFICVLPFLSLFCLLLNCTTVAHPGGKKILLDYAGKGFFDNFFFHLQFVAPYFSFLLFRFYPSLSSTCFVVVILPLYFSQLA